MGFYIITPEIITKYTKIMRMTLLPGENPGFSIKMTLTLVKTIWIGPVEVELRLVDTSAVIRVRTQGLWGKNPGISLILDSCMLYNQIENIFSITNYYSKLLHLLNKIPY